MRCSWPIFMGGREDCGYDHSCHGRGRHGRDRAGGPGRLSVPQRYGQDRECAAERCGGHDACADLLTDAIQAGPGLSALPAASASVLAGCGGIWLLEELVSGLQAGAKRGGLFLAGVVMAAAIALHNLPEGMVIGASYAADLAEAGQDGRMMALVIGLHNIPEGMAVAVPLAAGGASRGRAVLTTAAAGAPTVLGAVLGFCLGTMGPGLQMLTLGGASGAMLYVVFGELLPESFRLCRSPAPVMAAVLGVLTGMGVVLG